MLPKSPANDTSIEVAVRGGGSSDSANDTEVLKSGEMGESNFAVIKLQLTADENCRRKNGLLKKMPND